MTLPEPSDPTMTKSEHSNASETQENKLKIYNMKMIKLFKEEIKKFLKEVNKKEK